MTRHFACSVGFIFCAVLIYELVLLRGIGGTLLILKSDLFQDSLLDSVSVACMALLIEQAAINVRLSLTNLFLTKLR